MGLLFSRGRKQRSSKEILEQLEDDIKFLTEGKRRNTQYERSFVGYLLILSFFIYLIGLLIFYLYFLPSTWLEGVLYVGPLVLFPVIVYLLKKLLNIVFSHRTIQFDAKLRVLHEEKRKTLNDVMEKETYKTARELLEKYDPSNPSLQATPSRQPARRSSNQNGGGEMRRRRQPQTPHPAFMPQNIAMATPRLPIPPVVNTATPALPAPIQPVQMAPGLPPQAPPSLPPQATPSLPPQATPGQPPQATPGQPFQATPGLPAQTTGAPLSVPPTPQPSLQHIPPGMCVGAAPGPPTPCPILPRNRTNMDKMVEYLVGDGPNNRYALICTECKSHNGMALRDEFEYLTFRCAYCYTLNQARKKRPTLMEPPRPPSASGGEVAEEAVVETDARGNGGDHGTPRHRHRPRGQRSSSQSSEGTTTPTPAEQ